ncbi:hypothetical protein [Bacillus wiedmannii]|uniref:Cry55Aa2-like protein n=1 Tax=Bacillus thuringiensis TaxID=1428 RepID=A0A6F7TS58_BACTU|nr:Cry55Aa2-like protein [Bacillus thuringiensis]MED3079454.1 hypothetical protein [Bacillus wiedmannii]
MDFLNYYNKLKNELDDVNSKKYSLEYTSDGLMVQPTDDPLNTMPLPDRPVLSGNPNDPIPSEGTTRTDIQKQNPPFFTFKVVAKLAYSGKGENCQKARAASVYGAVLELEKVKQLPEYSNVYLYSETGIKTDRSNIRYNTDGIIQFLNPSFINTFSSNPIKYGDTVGYISYPYDTLKFPSTTQLERLVYFNLLDSNILDKHIGFDWSKSVTNGTEDTEMWTHSSTVGAELNLKDILQINASYEHTFSTSHMEKKENTVSKTAHFNSPLPPYNYATWVAAIYQLSIRYQRTNAQPILDTINAVNSGLTASETDIYLKALYGAGKNGKPAVGDPSILHKLSNVIEDAYEYLYYSDTLYFTQTPSGNSPTPNSPNRIQFIATDPQS